MNPNLTPQQQQNEAAAQAIRFGTPPVAANNVPISELSSQQPEVQLPEAPTLPTDTGVAAEGRTLLDQETARAQEEANRAASTVSDSERQVRQLFGITQTESQTRNQLEQQAGVNAFSQDLRKFQESLRRQVAELDQFDVDNTNTLEQMRVDASKRDITKRTYGAMSAEANIQMAVERANKVASTRATIAAIDVTQGNLQAATQQVDKALDAIYEPVRQQLEMEKFFLQRNDQRFDSAQRNLASTRMLQIQREEMQMQRVQKSVDNALSTGAATPNETYVLANPDTPDDERLALSQLIVSRGAMEARDLEMRSVELDMTVKAEQLAKLRTPSVATRETSVIDVNGNKQLIDTQTGDVIATFGAETTVNEIQQARDVNFINTVDSLKDHPGMAKAVGTTKLARYTPFKADVMTGQVSEFIGSVENITRQLTLNTFAEAKEKGLTFGATSQGEWDILGESATKIVQWRREREDGSIYYDAAEAIMKKELDTISNFGKMDAIRKGVNPADIGVLDLGNNVFGTRNSDGSFTEFVVKNGKIELNEI